MVHLVTLINPPNNPLLQMKKPRLVEVKRCQSFNEYIFIFTMDKHCSYRAGIAAEG